MQPSSMPDILSPTTKSQLLPLRCCPRRGQLPSPSAPKGRAGMGVLVVRGGLMSASRLPNDECHMTDALGSQRRAPMWEIISSEVSFALVSSKQRLSARPTSHSSDGL